MGNIGVTEILLIALVALLLFGARRIADIGTGLGQGIKEAEEIDADKKDEPAPKAADKGSDAPKQA